MRLYATVLAITAVVVRFLSAASAYPDGPIRMLIPLPAGTGADIQARLIGDAIAAYLGQPFVYVNKIGAEGELAVRALASSAPNGRTIAYLLDGQMATRPAACAAQGKMPYDPSTLSPIARTVDSSFVVIVGPSLQSKVNTLSGLIDYSRAHLVQFGSGNPTGRLGIAELNDAGADIEDVPYQGEPAAYIDLMAGRIGGLFSTYYLARSYLSQGKVRAIASIGSRNSNLPDVASNIEQGFPQLSQFSTWNGLFAPPGLPDGISAILSKATERALAQRTLISKLASYGFPVHFEDREKLRRLVGSQYRMMAAFIKKKRVPLPCD